jgi:hypothetical protein
MSNNVNPAGVVSAGLGKGCLAGLGLALLFFLISGGVYLALGAFSLERNIRLLFTFLSGPVIGTVLVVVVLYVQSLANQKNFDPKPLDDETADRD